MRTKHPDSKHLKCSFCHMTFDRRRSLSNHLRLHLLERAESVTGNKQTDAAIKHYTHAREVSKCDVGTNGRRVNSSEPSVVRSANSPVAVDVYPDNVNPDEDRINDDSRTANDSGHSANLPDIPPQLQCDVCSERFETEMILSKHLRAVHIKTSPANKNTNVFSGGEKMTRSTHSEENVAPKRYCGLSYSCRARHTKQTLRPIRQNSQVKCHICTVCGYSSYFKTNVERHFRLHTGEKPFKCRLCDYAAVQNSALLSHVRNKHPGASQFWCNLSGETHANLTKVRQHKKATHSSDTVAACTLSIKCVPPHYARKVRKDSRGDIVGGSQPHRQSDKVYKTLGKIDRGACNYSTHIEQPNSRYCIKTDDITHTVHQNATGTKSSLQTTHWVQRSVSEKACPVTTDTLTIQQEKHCLEANRTALACGQTGKDSGKKGILATRARAHPQKVHLGAIAGKKNAVATPKLKQRKHTMKANTHEQPQIHVKDTATGTRKMDKNIGSRNGPGIRHCPQSSDYKGLHLADKPYTCSVCKYSSVERSNRVEQMLLHTGEKPYKCTLCDYATGHNSNFYRHMRKDHPSARQFKCTVCGDGFVTPRQLTRHLQLHINTNTFMTPVV